MLGEARRGAVRVLSQPLVVAVPGRFPLVADATGAGKQAQSRVAQALADLPGAARALADLASSDEPAIALTAAYVLRRRAERTGPADGR